MVSNLGILVGYIIGHWLSYQSGPLVGAGISLIFILTFLCFPETPQYLVQTKRVEAAENALYTYKSNREISETDNTANIAAQINKLLETELRIFSDSTTESKRVYISELCNC